MKAALHQADLEKADLSGADLQGANLEEANLKEANLRGANLQGALFTDADFEPLWGELQSGLLAEIDYLHEAENIRRMTALHAGIDDIVIPRVVDEATARNVLTMEFVDGGTVRDLLENWDGHGER